MDTLFFFLKNLGPGGVVVLSKCYVIWYKVERELMLLFTCGYLQFNMKISDFKPHVLQNIKREGGFLQPRCKRFRKECQLWNRWLLKSSCRTIDISQQEPFVTAKSKIWVKSALLYSSIILLCIYGHTFEDNENRASPQIHWKKNVFSSSENQDNTEWMVCT